MKLAPEFNLIYLIGFSLEMLGICLLAFSVYILPHVAFGFFYPLPETLFSVEWWIDAHNDSPLYRLMIIVLPFFLSGLLCLFEVRSLTIRIEKQLLGQDDLSLADHIKVHYSEGMTAMVRVVLSVSSVFLISWLLTRLMFS